MVPCFRPFLPALLVTLAAVLAPSSLVAETRCIAQDDVAFRAPGDAPDAPPRGTLRYRNCFELLGSEAGQARLWLPKEAGFAGEVVVSEFALAQVLVDDVELRSAGGEVWGKALTGMLVRIEADKGDVVRVVSVEGRAKLRFQVSWDDLFPASSWPEPDSSFQPDSGWPVGERPLPLSGVRVKGSDGKVRADISSPLARVEDILMDPEFGGLRVRFDEEGRVVVVGRMFWLAGEVPASWAEEVSTSPDGVWAESVEPVVPNRVLKKGSAPLFREPKGSGLGELTNEHRFDVLETDGSWLKIRYLMDVGQGEGWLEKKQLQSEKKTPPLALTVQPGLFSPNLKVGRTAVQWADPEAHVDEDVPSLSLAPVSAMLAVGIESILLAYARELVEKPSLAGEVTLRLLVAPDGSVASRNVAIESVGNESVVAALLASLEPLRFEERKLSRKQRRSKVDHNLEVWVQLILGAN